jgi:hypothetical protein
MRRLALFVLLLALAGPAAHAAAPANLQKFLRDVIRLNDAEIASVEADGVITRLLPKSDEGEIAAFGIVRITTSTDAFEKLAREPARYRAMEGVEQTGVFSDPPAPADVAALAVPDDDIKALQKCSPGACDVKLTDDALEHLKGFDWKAPGAKERATAEFKAMVVAVASAYRGGGIAALGVIMDKKQPKSRADEFHRLLENSPYLYKYVPEFCRHIAEYPDGSFPGAATTLFWSKDTFSPKPTISLCAVTVVRTDEHVLVAQQLLAASHFFNAGLDVTIAVPGSSAEVYVVDVYRVRIDPPTGMMAGPAMKRVENGIKDGVEKTLRSVRSKLKP